MQGSFASTGPDLSATLLPDGSVLVVVRGDEDEDPISAEVWDPATSTFSPAGSHDSHREGTTLPDGRVFVIGDGEAEVWDPATSTFSPSGSFPGAYGGTSTVTALADGRALIVGGCSETQSCVAFADVAEVWEPDTETFVTAGSLSVTRADHSATLLPDGRVLVVGGFGEPLGTTCGFHDCVVRASAEVWEPSDR